MFTCEVILNSFAVKDDSGTEDTSEISSNIMETIVNITPTSLKTHLEIV